MGEAGKKLSSIFGKLLLIMKPGTNLLEIEKKAVDLIKETGGKPAFSRVPTYNWATCLNVNDGIVHGVPRDYLIQSGDLLNLDIGLFYKGYNTDMSATVYLGNKNPAVERFLKTGKKALKEAVKAAKPGNRVGHISRRIEEIVTAAGYTIAQNLTGHGIGRKLHEPPPIPGFLKGRVKETPLLKKGMCLAIEVIYCQGRSDLIVDPEDKWTIRTKDGKMSAVFEETIALTSDGPLVLTKIPLLTG